MKLYYYSDLEGRHGWFANPTKFRERFPDAPRCIRTAHVGIPAPAGYHKPNGELAFDAAEKTLTMKDFVKALTP